MPSADESAKSDRISLNRFRVKTYRSCFDTGFDLEQGLTAFIGPNGTGKTSLMHAMLLLVPSSYNSIRKDKEDFNKSSIDVEFENGPLRIGYRANLASNQDETDQLIVSDQEYRFSRDKISKKWIDGNTIEFASNYARRRNHPYDIDLPYSVLSRNYLNWSPFGRLLTPTSLESARKKIKTISQDQITTFDSVMRFRSGIKYYSASQFTNPQSCPTSFEIDLDRDGRLSEVTSSRRNPHVRFLYDLYRSKDTDNYKSFLTLIGPEGVGLIDGLDWQTIDLSSQTYEVKARGSVITKERKRQVVVPLVRSGSSQLSFNQLSEGTFRTIAMIYYIMTDNSSFLLLEEPEVCVHHGLLKSVIEIIKLHSAVKQIVISTHSEAVIDYLRPEQVRVVERDTIKGTHVRSLKRIFSKTELAELKIYLNTVGGLGEYWRSSGFSK